MANRWTKQSGLWKRFGSTISGGILGLADAGSEPVGSMSYSLPGNAIIVAKNGNDTTGDGTVNNPYLTIGKGLSMVASGGTVAVRAGVYHEGAVPGTQGLGLQIATANITLQNYPGEEVWLDGSSLVTSWTQDGSYWYTPFAYNFNRSGTYSWSGGTTLINPSYPYSAHTEQVWYNNTYLTQVGSLGEMGANKFFVDTALDRLYIGNNPSGSTIRVSDLCAAITFAGSGSGSILRGIGVRKYGNQVPDMGAIKVNRGDAVIENVWIEDCSAIGISVFGDTYNNVTLRKVTSIRNGLMGIQAEKANGLTIDRCVATGNNHQRFNFGQSAGGIKITRCRPVTVKDSVISNNIGHALWFDQSVYNARVYRCNMQNNEGTGLTYENCATAIFADCLITGNLAKGIHIFSSDNVRVWNNTIVDNYEPFVIQQDNRLWDNTTANRDSRYNPDPVQDWWINSVEFKNNVLHGTSVPAFRVKDDDNTAPKREFTDYGILSDGNVFNRPSGTSNFWHLTRSSGTDSYFNNFTTFKATATTFDANSVFITGASAVGPDYMLTEAAETTSINSARPLPYDVSVMLGWETTTKLVGAWRYVQTIPDAFVPSNTQDAGSLPIGSYTYSPIPTAIYVATTGNDTTGNGTSGAPYASLAKAITMASAGNTILLRGGIYHHGAAHASSSTRVGINIDKTLTIQNYSGEAVWFDGSSIHTGWTQDGSVWRKNIALTFDRSPTHVRGAADSTEVGWQYVDPAYPTAPWPEQVFVDGVALEQVSTLGEVGPGKFFVEGSYTGSGTTQFEFTSTAYVIGTNPTGKEVRVTDLVTCLAMLASDVVIKGIGFRRFGASVFDYGVIKMNRPAGRLENVVIEDCSGRGVYVDGSGQGFAHTNTNLVKVTIQRCGLMGGGGSYSDNLTIDRCKFVYNTTGRFNRAPVTGGWKQTKSLNTIVKNSIISDNYRQGLWFDETVTGIGVYSCDIQRNGGNGVVPEISEEAVIVNCLITDNTRSGIYNSGVNNSRFWNNTVARNGSESVNGGTRLGNIYVYQDSRRPATFSQGRDSRYDLAWHEANNSWNITSIEMCNNINDEPVPLASMFRISDDGTHTGWDSFGLVANGNLYCDKDSDVTWAFAIPESETNVFTAWASFPPYQAEVAGQELASKAIRGGASCVLDSNNKITVLGKTTATPLPIPSDIATLIGVAANTVQIGAWR